MGESWIITTVDQIISALWICMPFCMSELVLLGGVCVCVPGLLAVSAPVGSIRTLLARPAEIVWCSCTSAEETAATARQHGGHTLLTTVPGPCFHFTVDRCNCTIRLWFWNYLLEPMMDFGSRNAPDKTRWLVILFTMIDDLKHQIWLK